ncbi:CST complex subunit CTC1 isoform X1 [Primulina huaijiensis]|uniref:CST complex subunit CTC1 isoform X1 n=2 Tax=Primulina huaijiensis TaxID=1492673 RepID=UPI003CC72AE8
MGTHNDFGSVEEDTTILLKISDLIQRARPHTAASSLNPSRHVSTSKPHRNFDKNRRQAPFCQNPVPDTLKPLDYKAKLIGTLTLPSYATDCSIIKCSCFQFSDDSGSVCCDILDFDPKMIGTSIRVLSWNFFPSLKSESRSGKGGFLEILTWDFLQSCSENVCSFVGFSSFCLNFGDCKVSPKVKYLIFGRINSISPVYVVPCANDESVPQTLCGFLVSVFVCECKFCSSKFFMSELNGWCGENVKGHCFSKREIVYFCGSSSSWHPVISRLIGDVVLLSNLKKKMVFIGKEKSVLMYLTTNEVSFHIPKLYKKRTFIHNYDTRGKGEYGSYTGIVTGVYMKGMVAELDRDVMLLLTDQQLTIPHSLRVGAIVTLENVHVVDPKFSWGKMLILGACCRTSVNLKSFSPLDTGFYLKSHSQSLLRKFIDCLPYSTRLWVLLVISCFRKKFTGIFSDMEILGSKHKEGLAQKYALSHLPLSVIHVRRGVLLEFCKLSLCPVDHEVHYQLRLLLPIGHLISYCEASWKKILGDWSGGDDFSGSICPKKTVSCGGRFYAQSIRKVIYTEDIGVLVVGTLKVSLSSGRLQLVDATGGMDVVLDLPVLSVVWDIDRILEAKDFIIIIEGKPGKLVRLDLHREQLLSCRSIFDNASLPRRMKLSPCIYLKPSSEDSNLNPWSLLCDHKRNLQEHESGKFHLLLLTHKFPVQQMFQLGQAKKSAMFAQAIVLPWDLLVAEKNKESDVTLLSLDHLGDSLEKFTRSEKVFVHKRCKFDRSVIDASNIRSDAIGNGSFGHFPDPCDSYISCRTENCSCISNLPIELSCLISNSSVNYHRKGTLQYTDADNKIVPCCKPQKSTVLLEFNSESFCVFEALRIGSYYLVKHEEKDMICFAKRHSQIRPAKVFINAGMRFQSFVFSTIDSLQTSKASFLYSSRNLGQERFLNEIKDGSRKHFSSDVSTDNGCHEIKVTRPINNDGIENTNIRIIVPTGALNLLENLINTLCSSMEELDNQDSGGTKLDALKQSAGGTYPDHRLPEGNLITLQGLVTAFHDYNRISTPEQSTLVQDGEGLPMFLQGSGYFCVHVLVDGHIIRIIGNVNKQAYPIGLGRDTYVTFHRILRLSGQNKYMMMPVSFITIHYVSLVNEQHSDELNHTPVAIPTLAPAALISEVLQSSEPKPMQFCCRVVAVYVVVLEKNRNITQLQSGVRSTLSVVQIPFAGFVLDDGSSSCCCWADSEKAATLLGLDSEEFSHNISSAETVAKSQTGPWLPCISTMGRLKQILKQHQRIVAKNYGAMLDSSCQDLTFSFDSNTLINSSDDYLLRSLIGNACFSKFWTVVGNLMDPSARRQLEERLCEQDMTMPGLQNVWATSVSQANMLAEARNIMKQLS